jgi:two-component system nitrate/nitrite response regulator NarL
MMRILVCAIHPVFAESLAHLLEIRGNRVVAVVDRDEALLELQVHPVDLCLLDASVETEADVTEVAGLCQAAPETRFVLISDETGRRVVANAASAGIRAVAEKRKPFAELAELLERVNSGAVNQAMVATQAPPVEPGGGNDRQWLATFLTPRERQVLSALVCGDDTVKLARSMGISATTVRCHIQSVLNKLGAHSRLEAATAAVRCGMVSPGTGEWLVDFAS